MSYSCDEQYDVYRESVRKARTPKKCDACAASIVPGDYYCRVSCVFDHSAEGINRCGACQKTHEHLRDVIDANGLGGEVWPDERLACGLDYAEEWGEVPDDVAALAFVPQAERGRLLKPEPKEVSP